MPASELLRLIIQADTAGAVKGIERLGSSADKSLGKVEDRTTRVGKNLQKFGAGAVVTGALFTGAMYKAGQSAADLEQAVGGTEAVFKDAKGPIEDYAKTAATGMGLSERAFREATTSLGGQLKALGFDVDQAANKSIELTGVAADLAATYGGTTAEAVQALGAAFRGEADPAERFNLRLNQNTVNAKAVAMGLAESTSQVDAQAKAQATLALITEQSADAQGQFAREAGSASGAMQIANAQFENAKASLGQAVAPIIADVANKLSGLTSGFASANEASGGLLSKLAAYGAIGLTAGGGIAFVVGKAIELRGNLGKISGPLKNTEGGLNAVGKAGVVAGTALAAWSVGKMIEGATEAKIDLDALATSLAEVGAVSSEQAAETIAGLKAFGELDDTVKDLAATNVIAAERMVEAAEAAGVQGDELQNLKDIVDQKRQSDIQGTKDQEAYSEQVEAAVGPTDELTGSLGEEVATLEELEDALLGAYEATLRQFDANLNYRQSIDDTEGSLADLVETQKEHGSNSEEYRDALLETEGALLSQAEAAVRLYEDTVTAAGGTLTATEKAQIYKSELGKLAATLAPGSPLRAQLQGYIDQLGKIPSAVQTRLDLSVSTSGAQFSAGAAINAYNRMLEGRATGGPVNANQPYWVGERGKEVFVPDSDGTIIPNGTATSSARPASTEGDTIVIQVDGREIARAVRRADSDRSRFNGLN